MEKDTIILTRKVQNYLDCDDKEQRSAYFKQLFEWQDMVYRGANMVMTHHFIQEQIKDLIYLRDDIKLKLADHKKDPDGIFTSSKMNTTYRILTLYFKGKLPSGIISTMNMTLNKLYSTDRIAYWKGEKSLRNYKKDMPIPFGGHFLKLSNDDKGQNFKFTLFKIPFRTTSEKIDLIKEYFYSVRLWAKLRFAQALSSLLKANCSCY